MKNEKPHSARSSSFNYLFYLKNWKSPVTGDFAIATYAMC